MVTTRRPRCQECYLLFLSLLSILNHLHYSYYVTSSQARKIQIYILLQQAAVDKRLGNLNVLSFTNLLAQEPQEAMQSEDISELLSDMSIQDENGNHQGDDGWVVTSTIAARYELLPNWLDYTSLGDPNITTFFNTDRLEFIILTRKVGTDPTNKVWNIPTDYQAITLEQHCQSTLSNTLGATLPGFVSWNTTSRLGAPVITIRAQEDYLLSHVRQVIIERSLANAIFEIFPTRFPMQTNDDRADDLLNRYLLITRSTYITLTFYKPQASWTPAETTKKNDKKSEILNIQIARTNVPVKIHNVRSNIKRLCEYMVRLNYIFPNTLLSMLLDQAQIHRNTETSPNQAMKLKQIMPYGCYQKDYQDINFDQVINRRISTFVILCRPSTLIERRRRIIRTKARETTWECPDCDTAMSLYEHLLIQVGDESRSEARSDPLAFFTTSPITGLTVIGIDLGAREKAGHTLTTIKRMVINEQCFDAFPTVLFKGNHIRYDMLSTTPIILLSKNNFYPTTQGFTLRLTPRTLFTISTICSETYNPCQPLANQRNNYVPSKQINLGGTSKRDANSTVQICEGEHNNPQCMPKPLCIINEHHEHTFNYLNPDQIKPQQPNPLNIERGIVNYFLTILYYYYLSLRPSKCTVPAQTLT